MAVQVARAEGSGTLFDTVAARRRLDRTIQVAAVLFITALTAAAAQISIPLPFTPVPFTLTPMIVLLGGVVLGPRLGMASQVLYLLIGIAGFPVFAASPLLPQGIVRLLGPTGGYLMSYPVAALLTGALAARGFDRHYVTSVMAMAAGLAVIFACGVTWLAWFAQPARLVPERGIAAADHADDVDVRHASRHGNGVERPSVA